MARQTTAQGWTSFPSQLKATAAAIGLLVVGPGIALTLLPRPRALGLERLLGHVSLLQSFPAQVNRPTPALWQQYLGVKLAHQAWVRPGLWWQFWAEHGDGQPYLAVPWAVLPAVANPQLPANSLRVDDLLVVAPDPLSRKLLGGELRTRQRRSRGLDQRCLSQLQQGQAVYWNPSGLGSLLGPLAPLLQRFQQGCLSLDLRGDQLLISGESTATEGYWMEGGAAPAVQEPLEPLDRQVLLELRGPALGIIFDGLLARQLVRQPLQERYGLDDRALALVRRTPFALQISPEAKGPYQAGLQLHLAIGRQQRAWKSILQGLRQALRDQGLIDSSPQLNSIQWRNGDGRLLGGWRLIAAGGAEPDLLLFLGPDPLVASKNLRQSPKPLVLPGPNSQGELRLRPAALAELGLLPKDLPGAVQRSLQLDLAAGGAPTQPLSQLVGRLRWDRLR